ncbi:hypothetical protein GJV76_14025 [Myroides sp. BIT-d1]|uniref:Nitrogen regulatory IIA protein n=1 Tax=Myroides albus TaxID=2562892 RepID=A0A6I3LRB8_9FLAO|nr:hypothetical protein [Myroides albus]MTG99231.1 hypothetical protein [Myroides albus]
MKKLQFLRHSYSSKLQVHWDSLTIAKQKGVLLTVFALYALVCLLVVKMSFSTRTKPQNRLEQSPIKPVNYSLEKQKDKISVNY